MDIKRPPIPEAIKRQLRQESGFGCAICGFPIYDYHHIIPWAQEEHNRPEDMMILCPNHHREASYLNEDKQRKIKQNPINMAVGQVYGKLRINQKALAVKVGTLELVNSGKVICINNEPIISLGLSSEGTLNVSLKLYDENDKLCLVVDYNEWIYGDIKVWDIKFKYNKLTILKKNRHISIVIDASAEYVSLKGQFWRDGKRVFISDSKFIIDSPLMSSGQSEFQNICYVGGFIDVLFDKQIILKMTPTDLGKGQMTISEPDPIKRIKRGIETYANKFAQLLS